MSTRREEEARDAGYDPSWDDNRPVDVDPNAMSDFVKEVRRLQGRCYSCGTTLSQSGNVLSGGICPECTTTMEGEDDA